MPPDRQMEVQEAEREIEEVHEPPYRYTAICWDDDCPGGLDTYGREDILDYAREHVAQHGHELRVQVQSVIVIRPKKARA